jgi:hypothetical protein
MTLVQADPFPITVSLFPLSIDSHSKWEAARSSETSHSMSCQRFLSHCSENLKSPVYLCVLKCKLLSCSSNSEFSTHLECLLI